ncbi:transglutaminase family protein [Frankia sp. R82]|uniref:transglutaminase-like domain-containing protein n=1 Tax=Frankia sp. R82 TaxID=2950553 RepID=UPI00204383C2|nr:transglutaminase-like domain-containing protein [Frankia sp. R82]MCM3885609.1 transglutaminase-like domain-containing protein [Frankia sp. R82]
MSGRTRLAALLLIGGLVFVAGYGWHQVFAGPEILVDVVAAVILPVTLVAVLGGRHQPSSPVVTVVAWSSGFVAWAAATIAVPAGGVWSRLHLVGSGVVTGWARLLDTAVPVPAEADLLLGPVALTWLAAALGAELVVRTRTRLLPALPGTILLLVTVGYGTAAGGSDLLAAAGFAALAALLVQVRRPRIGTAVGAAARPATLARPVGAVIAVVAVGIGLAGGPLRVDDRPPIDPRSYRAPAATAVADLSPLSRLAGWTAHPDQVLFRTALTPATTGPVALRLAVLDAYDGATWTATTRYLPAGTASAGCPEVAWPTDTGAAVTQELTIAGLGGQLIPVSGQPRQFAVLSSPSRPVAATTAGQPAPGRFAVAACAGSLLRTEPLTPGTHLRVQSWSPSVLTPAQTLALAVSAAPADARDRALPATVPPVLRNLATIATAGGSSPYQRAALLRQYLRANFVFDPTAPAGHSLAQIAHFLEQTGRGTSEQFATVFVLAARLLGLPARLVVGFSAPGPDPSVPRTVHGADALAWAEIHFAGAGWLPFFPTPMAGDVRGAAVAGAAQGESMAQAELVNAVLGVTVAVPSGGAVPGTDPRPRPISPSPGWSDWARGVRLAGTATLLVLAGYLGLAWSLPGLRRRRARRRGTERMRIVAAWRQALDVLARTGQPMPPAASPAEVVAMAAVAVAPAGGPAGTALRGLAELATVALFGDLTDSRLRAAPGRGGAAEAWRQTDALEQALHRSVSRHRRIAHRIAPVAVAAEVRAAVGLGEPADLRAAAKPRAVAGMRGATETRGAADVRTAVETGRLLWAASNPARAWQGQADAPHVMTSGSLSVTSGIGMWVGEQGEE